jgi:hypothetical protein
MYKWLTGRELMGVQAEILDLRERLGISYKDAAHRLYMAELERVKKADSAARGAAALERQLEHMISEDMAAAISAIDEGRFDSVRDGEGSRIR